MPPLKKKKRQLVPGFSLNLDGKIAKPNQLYLLCTLKQPKP